MLRALFARLFRRPEFEPVPPPVPCWTPAVGERVWCVSPPAPMWPGFDGPVFVTSVRVPGLEFNVRNDGRDAHEFFAYRGELLPAAPAEDVLEQLRAISAEVARP